MIVSGGHPEQIIKKAYPDDGRVVKAFVNDTAAIYKQFLGLFKEFPALTTSRIYVDVFELIDLKVDDCLYGESVIDWDDAIEKYFHNLSLEEVIAAEAELLEKHLRLWRQGQVDVCLTRFSSLVRPLDKKGVNVRFMYPNKAYIQDICREVATQVKLEFLEDNRPAVVLVTTRDNAAGPKTGGHPKDDPLGKWLRVYAKKFDPEAIIKPGILGYEVISSRKAVEAATNGLTLCRVQRSLKQNLSFPVSIGYGLGLTLPQARLNAMDANREALLHGGESYLINELDELIGPLEQGHPLVVSRKASPMVQEVSSKAGLSSLTVQKVLSVVEEAEDGCITSQYLAQKLSVTQRSANRFLSALLASGKAEVIGMRRATTRGRPERLYRLLYGSASENYQKCDVRLSKCFSLFL